MKIVISGARGLVGSALVPVLRSAGHEVRPLTREGSKGSGADPNGITWNTATGELDLRALENWGGPDAVIHLAGENIADGRWTKEKKNRIRDSRVALTQQLVKHLIQTKIQVFVGASAIGFYGNRGDEVLTEASARGDGFLAETCEDWENAPKPLSAAGVRVSHLRFGMILSGKGGALARLLPVFKAGLGGRVGNGQQWVSWIALEDAVRAIAFLLESRSGTGAFNAVAPNPVHNADFCRALAEALGKPALVPVPAIVLRAVFGELAEAVLLSSQRVLPERLLAAGFRFALPTLPEAIKSSL